MSKGAWGGLITNASPFALPVGAAVEQVNLAADVAGQIYTRGGMWPVAFATQDAASGPFVDCHPYARNGQSWLLCMKDDGSLVSLAGPAYGEEPAAPLEPQLSAASGMASSYTMRYVVGAVDDPPQAPQPDPTALVSALFGGKASTSSWPYVANAASLCAGSGKQSHFVGGSAGTTVFPDSTAPSELCTA